MKMLMMSISPWTLDIVSHGIAKRCGCEPLRLLERAWEKRLVKGG